MSERAPYSRVYWSVIDDPKFLTVFDDDRHLAAWLRLLLIADQSHPASGHVPANVRRASVTELERVGLIDVAGSRFRLHGLDAERERRSEAGRVGGLASGRSRTVERPFNERATAPTNEIEPRRDEQRRDETSRTREVPDGRADLEAFLMVTRRAPTDRQRLLLDRLLDYHDVTGPQWAADIILRHPDDPIGAVIAADKAWREERRTEAIAVEKPPPVVRRSRGLPQSARDILAELKRQDAEKGVA